MKKSYPTDNIHQKEGQEQSKKLYRFVDDTSDDLNFVELLFKF